MNTKLPVRAAALVLGLTLALSPMAGAITVDEARELLRENYIDEIPEEILALPTIDEITDALGDPYTYYMTAEEYAAFQSDMDGTDVVGIGVMVEKTADGLLVSSVAPETPAARAGLRIGDLIVAADGTTIQEAGTPDALAALITGEAGTDVTITILREEEELSLTLTREAVVFPTVTGEVVDEHIGWLHCTSFGTDSGAYFQTYITEEDEAADRWVIDLRSNPGGAATAVIEAVGHVLGNYDVAYLVDRQGSLSVWRPNPSRRRSPASSRSPWWCWWTATRPAPPSSSPPPCGTITTASSSAPAPSARASPRACSPFRTARSSASPPSGTTPRPM